MDLKAELPSGYRLVSFDSVESTNTEAMRLAASGDTGHVWLAAGEQVKGRGRSGRAWTSVPGNLYASLLLRLSCGPETAQQLALLTGVAVVDAVRKVAEGLSAAPQNRGGLATLRLKWPNDILMGPAKLGGILLESAQGLGGSGLVAVVGIGLNVAGTPKGLGRAATSLAESGFPTDYGRVLTALARTMDGALAIWDEGIGFAAIRAAWEERAGPVGELLTINSAPGPVTGRYSGLDRDGALLLADGLGVLHRFTYGDVTLAGPVSEH